MQHPELQRLQNPLWKKWGPYLSERQWGTVREDYSEFGSAWDFFPHDHARSRTYRWGEDGIAGISDDKQLLCFAPAFWNGNDPIIKERLFGLTGLEGHRNEDVKEYYYNADATPTASYLKYIYKYPIKEFPYAKLVEEAQKLKIGEREYELADTAIFSYEEYFNIVVEYFKIAEEDIVIKITAENKSDKGADLHLLPTLWCRNTWIWNGKNTKPNIKPEGNKLSISHPDLGEYFLNSEENVEWLFTENETNATRLYGLPSLAPYVKDAFNEWLIEGRKDAINPSNSGTKAAGYTKWHLLPGKPQVLTLRLSKKSEVGKKSVSKLVEEVKTQADDYYSQLLVSMPDTHRHIAREALSGLVWGKQYYDFNVKNWLNGDPKQFPPPELRKSGRNHNWKHIDCRDIISMPDKWEYPWFAAWDTAFHAIPLARIDADFAKNQIKLFIEHRYMSPSGQIPAYEWAFGDVNPPVNALGAWKVYCIEKQTTGKGDLEFLQSVYMGLAKNYQWWMATQRHDNEMLFKGGFMGLDNVSVIDRGKPLPENAQLIQADSLAWMGTFCLNMINISLELADINPWFEAEAEAYFLHFLEMAESLNKYHWCEKEKIYADFILKADGSQVHINVRNIVGLLPLSATECFLVNEKWKNIFENILSQKPHLGRFASIHAHKMLLSLVPMDRYKQVHISMSDESRYLSKYGIRSLSKEYQVAPFVFDFFGNELQMEYAPAESLTADFGENSNWRGPVWFPVNYVLINALYRMHDFYGDSFTLNFPSFPISRQCTLRQIAENISVRLISIFENTDGERPVYRYQHILFEKPDFNQNILFYEYFDGDTGRGCGASHQTGWTALVADLIFMLKQSNFC